MNKRVIIQRISYKSIIIILVIGLLFYYLNFLTPLNWDDYSYKFISQSINDKTTYRPVNNLVDIIGSLFNSYFFINGRSLCNFFIHLFSGIIGKEIFNFVNTLLFIGFIILLNIYNNKFNPLYLIFSFSLVFLLFPAFNETILWMTGSINYLWSCTGILIFLCLFKYFSYTTFKNNYYCIILFIISLILGWSNEGISLPLAGALIIYFLWKRFNINTFLLFLIFGFITGSFICSFAPSTINRSGMSQNSLLYTFIHKGESFIIVLCKLRAFYVLILLFLIKYINYFRRNKNDLFSFYKINFILIFSALFSFIIIFLAGQTDTRSAVGVEFFSLLLILKLFSYGSRKFNQNGLILFGFLTIFLLPFIFYYSYVNYRNFKSAEYQLTNTNNEIILYDDIRIPYIFQKYILVPRSYNFISYKLGNGALNLYYDKPIILFLPNNIYKDIKKDKDILIDIFSQKNYKFYVLPIKFNDRGKTPYFKLNIMNNIDIPIFLRPFKNKLDRYSASEIPIKDYQTVSINGNYYLVIGRNEIIDKRINSINLK